MEGQESIRDVLKRREEREEARQAISEAAKKRARKEARTERDRQNIVFKLNGAQTLCLWDLVLKRGRGAAATLVDTDNYGSIKVFISRDDDYSSPALYKLPVQGGVEVLEYIAPQEPEPAEDEEEPDAGE